MSSGGQYPIAAWTLAGWAVHLAVDALGPQGVVCAGRRAAARLYSGALRPALALLGMLAAGCLWILGLRWTPERVRTLADASLRRVADRVAQCVREGAQASSVAVFARRKATLEQVAKELRARQIPVEFYEKADRFKSLGLSEPGVKLVTIHSAKGIEFPVVFIVGVTEDAFPSEGPAEEVERARRVLYTAIMRAGWRLTLSAVRGRASGLLSCIQEP